jgi:hypothetical protein
MAAMVIFSLQCSKKKKMMDEGILKKMATAREDRTKQANRQRRVSKLFFDLEQQTLYPGANVLSLPGDTFETLSIQSPDLDDEANMAGLETNLRLLSKGNLTFVESTKAFILKSYSNPGEIASLLVASWDDVKAELKKQFNGKTVQPSAFQGFLRKYLHDAGEKAATGPAKKPLPSEVGFTVLQGSVPIDELKANIDRAYQHSPDVVIAVLEKAHPNRDISDLSKAQLAAMQKDIYFQLYGLQWRGQGKKGAAAGEVEYSDSYAANSPFQGAPRSSGSPQRAPVQRTLFGNGLQAKKTRKGKPPILYGRGVSSQISAKYYVDLKKMNQDPPHLSVKYKSTARSVMDQETTPAVKSIVMGILSSSKLDEKQYARMSAAEKDQVLMFLVNSGAKYVDIYTSEVEELSTKLTILVGSMNAGNDSAVLREMALATAERLHRFKAITRLEWLSLKESM